MSLLPGESLSDDLSNVKAGDTLLHYGAPVTVAKVDKRHGGTIYIPSAVGPLVPYDMRGRRRGAHSVRNMGDCLVLPTPALIEAANRRKLLSSLPAKISAEVVTLLRAGNVERLQAALAVLKGENAE